MSHARRRTEWIERSRVSLADSALAHGFGFGFGRVQCFG